MADRLVINLRKQRVLGVTRNPETGPSPGPRTEVDALMDGVLEDLAARPDLLALFLKSLVRLADVNYAIWDLEFELRMGRMKEEDLAKIGARALRIRDLNAIRVRLKNEISCASATGFAEVKVDHLGEETGK